MVPGISITGVQDLPSWDPDITVPCVFGPQKMLVWRVPFFPMPQIAYLHAQGTEGRHSERLVVRDMKHPDQRRRRRRIPAANLVILTDHTSIVSGTRTRCCVAPFCTASVGLPKFRRDFRPPTHPLYYYSCRDVSSQAKPPQIEDPWFADAGWGAYFLCSMPDQTRCSSDQQQRGEKLEKKKLLFAVCGAIQKRHNSRQVGYR